MYHIAQMHSNNVHGGWKCCSGIKLKLNIAWKFHLKGINIYSDLLHYAHKSHSMIWFVVQYCKSLCMATPPHSTTRTCPSIRWQELWQCCSFLRMRSSTDFFRLGLTVLVKESCTPYSWAQSWQLFESSLLFRTWDIWPCPSRGLRRNVPSEHGNWPGDSLILALHGQPQRSTRVTTRGVVDGALAIVHAVLLSLRS